MFRLFITCSIVFLALSTTAQSSLISGRLVTEQGEALQGAIIRSSEIGVFSDEFGAFTIQTGCTDTVDITIQYLGFETKSIDVVCGGEKVLGDIVMKESRTNISQIVIYAESNRVFSPSINGSSSTIHQRQLQLQNPIGTEEVLRQVPGLVVAGDMGISNRLNVGIRGSYPRRASNLLLLEDGVPIAPAPYLAPEAYYNPPTERMKSIDVIKGADMLLFGSNTMYGTINYITKMPSPIPRLNVQLIGGERGYQSQYLTYGGTWNKLGAELQVLHKQFDGFQDNSQSAIFNVTGKLYSEFNDRSSLYVKFNAHTEESKATYSALTPFSYTNNAEHNPFDADDLSTKRYAMDAGYKYELTESVVLNTSAYVSQFERNWWRQENTVIRAGDALSYLGQTIIDERYSYLNEGNFGVDDYVRVGRVVNGRESTRARNRTFRVGGIQQSLSADLDGALGTDQFEVAAGVRAHWESFENVEIKNDSSRFARSGTIDRDQYYILGAYSAFAKMTMRWGKWELAPLFRAEMVNMRTWDRLAISHNPNNTGDRNFGSLYNDFTSFLPGGNVSYTFSNNSHLKSELFAGAYSGYTAPTAEVGFLNVTDGAVSSTGNNDMINRTPERSINYEVGYRHRSWSERLIGQMVYFNNHIENYYSAGRNEAFQTLGSATISGVELGVMYEIFPTSITAQKHHLTLQIAASYIQGQATGGVLRDTDLLRVKHTDETKEELVGMINDQRTGYEVYFTSSTGTDSLVTRTLTAADFSTLRRIDFRFGEGGITDKALPYVPNVTYNIGLTYSYKRKLDVLVNYNYVGKQYTDYLNFENESGDGAIGALPAYGIWDATITYRFETKRFKNCGVFVAGKNLTDEVFRASRLHRVSSGIMPGGFRQINLGLRFDL